MPDNLQLTIELGSGVAIGHPWINGEGLIERLALIDEVGRDYHSFVARLEQQGPVDLRPQLDTGLSYTDDVAHASVSQFDTDRRATTKLYSSYDEVRAHTVESRRTKIPIGGGSFKSRMIDVVYVPARQCVFFFRGGRDRLAELLDRHLTDLGKHTARGFGKVLDWRLDELDVDYSVEHPSEGVAMRPLPTDRLDRWDDAETLTWRCPYHADRFAAECAPPGAAVEPAW